MSPKTILVADDDENLREVVGQILISQGYEVLTAADGREAIAVIAQKKPPVVLLDILMPNVAGYDVCSFVKNDPDLKPIKVIMLTALSTQSSQDLAKMSGADAYLVKPFRPAELLKKIGEYFPDSKPA